MTAPSRLVTIGLSHFCEKGRWALELAGIPYEERPHPPGMHLPFVLRHRWPTTPVLELAGGDVVRGSVGILEYAAAHGAPWLLPDDPDEEQAVRHWMTVADTRLGPATRRWFYTYGTSDPALMTLVMQVGNRGWQRTAGQHLGWAVRPLIRGRFGVRDGAREEAAAEIREVFAAADAARPAGSPYLVGDRFTGADLTFAALGAPACFPDGYGPPDMPGMDVLPDEVLIEVDRWRAEPSAEAIATVYARHRRPAVVTA